MFQRISNSWELVKASAGVLRADKELVVFPIISAICVLLVTLTFALPSILAGLVDSVIDGEARILGTAIAFLFYLVQYFVIFFFNSALVGAATIRLRGGDPTVGDGFRIAGQHIGSILGYAFMAATVGMILRWLSERAGVIGRIVISIVGLVWNVATYLVVPVLVVEGVDPITGVKRSVELLKQTWGEQIVGNLGIGTVFGLITFLIILAGVPLIFLAVSAESLALIIAAVVVLVLALTFVGLVNSTLSGIYVAAVYQYATTGEASGYFRSELVKNAFRQK